MSGTQGSGSGTPRLTGIDLGAILASLLWIGAAGLVVLSPQDGGGALRIPLIVLGVLVPLALIWTTARVLRGWQAMRDDLARLQLSVDTLRHAQLAQAQAGQPVTPASAPPAPDRRQIEPRDPDPMADPAPVPDPVPGHAEQGQLNLEPTAPQPEADLRHQDFVSAMNFPQSAEDTEGFAALRRARASAFVAPLVQAAEDVLTLLSQDGIYMDDLSPDKARPEIWRQFAKGVRGREISALGGVREAELLDRTARRLKEDPIFRDAVLHFLRRFDQVFSAFEAEATDLEIAELGDTRTARAFMLVGRVAGTFD
ncbi:MAG: hypothetical protein OIF47_11705 [Marinibacterium sp.]|nr:hypothetical protein [Marinibacterium sp.]